eukprot:TRINITY_DN5822_c0_g1_i1.p1 TRINITY_DN5822_c0_g1~~TRINITY_DN5822_c0_g1_i1.p1  ORF type:complete len:359 (-),score=43.78 TRINITY_DN5822_c0_g1_i1:133-1209(-)
METASSGCLQIDWLPREIIHAAMLMVGSRSLGLLDCTNTFFHQLVPRVVVEACTKFGALHLARLHKSHSIALSIAEKRMGAIVAEMTRLRLHIKRPSSEAAASVNTLRGLLGDNGADGDMLIAAGIIEPLVQVLKAGEVKGKRAAARALRKLVVNSDDRKALVTEGGVIQPLVDLLRSGDTRGKGYAAFALGALADRSNERMAEIAAAGAIPPLVDLLASGDVWDKRAAASTLGSLADRSEERSQEIVNCGAVALLVELLESGDLKGKKAPAFALGSLAVGSQERCANIIEEGAVPALVELLQKGDPHDKGYASRALLHLLPCRMMGSQPIVSVVGATLDYPVPDNLHGSLRDKLHIS